MKWKSCLYLAAVAVLPVGHASDLRPYSAVMCDAKGYVQRYTRYCATFPELKKSVEKWQRKWLEVNGRLAEQAAGRCARLWSEGTRYRSCAVEIEKEINAFIIEQMVDKLKREGIRSCRRLVANFQSAKDLIAKDLRSFVKDEAGFERAVKRYRRHLEEKYAAGSGR